MSALPPFPVWLILECPVCDVGSDVNEWRVEGPTVICPDCGAQMPAAFVTDDPAWQHRALPSPPE